jgi:hypothetical protein
LFDAKGDLLVATSADTPGKLTVGTNGTVLLADSTTATGLKWSAYDPLPSQTSNSGKFLTTDGTATSWGAAVTSVASGDAARISIGGTASAPTVDLATTAVTAGSYTATTLTVDAYGRITAASNGSAGGTTNAKVYFMRG